MADVDVVGEAGDGTAAVRAIGTLRPDVVLLDVQMPGLSGFDVVAEASAEHLPLVVFVTAYDEYALRAFEVHAFDYLLKPVNGARLADAMARVRANLARGGAGARTAGRCRGRRARRESPGAAGTTCAPDAFRGEGSRSVCAGARDGPRLGGRRGQLRPPQHPGACGFLLRMTLADMERQLDPREFARIHRSTIVNTTRIKEIRPDAHGDYDVVLADGHTLKMSRSFRGRLLGRQPIL